MNYFNTKPIHFAPSKTFRTTSHTKSYTTLILRNIKTNPFLLKLISEPVLD